MMVTGTPFLDFGALDILGALELSYIIVPWLFGCKAQTFAGSAHVTFDRLWLSLCWLFFHQPILRVRHHGFDVVGLRKGHKVLALQTLESSHIYP